MPYKSKEQRNDAIKRWKERNREKYLESGREYYYRTRGPLKPKVVRSEKELKAMKAADDRRYRKKHEKKVKSGKARYYQKNKARIIRKELDSLKTNIQKRISHNLRNRIRQAVKCGYKVGSAVKNLGCTIPEFKSYIANKFSVGMTWENYGKWHLDHMTPLCKFDMTDLRQFNEAVHYTNYQPLWAVDNLRKSKY